MSDRPHFDSVPDETETALKARFDEISARAGPPHQSGPPGNLVEQLWRYLRVFISAPLIAAAVVVFGGFHILEFYVQAQLTTVETHLRQAISDANDVRSQGQITLIDGLPLRVTTFQAEVALKQAQAARAKVEADAQTAVIKGTEIALAKVRADVGRLQAEAKKAKLAAEVATAQFGYHTLLEREQFVQFVKTELDKMTARHNIAAQNVNMNDSSLYAGYADRTYPTMIDARCKENALAKYLGCPARYFSARAPSKASPLTARPDKAAAPSFDCGKAHYADERAICSSPKLARLDVLNSKAFAELLSVPLLRSRVVERNRLVLRSRRNCRDDIGCIEAVQRKALQGFQALGATVSE